MPSLQPPPSRVESSRLDCWASTLFGLSCVSSRNSSSVMTDFQESMRENNGGPLVLPCFAFPPTWWGAQTSGISGRKLWALWTVLPFTLCFLANEELPGKLVASPETPFITTGNFHKCILASAKLLALFYYPCGPISCCLFKNLSPSAYRWHCRLSSQDDLSLCHTGSCFPTPSCL